MDKREQYIDKQIIEQIMELRKQLHRIPEHSMQEVTVADGFLKIAYSIRDRRLWGVVLCGEKSR